MSIVLDGREVKVGDKLWSFTHGWVKIEWTDYSVGYPLLARTLREGMTVTFSISGKSFNSLDRVLFWDEIKFEIPKPSKKKVKKYRYAYQVSGITYLNSCYCKDDEEFENSLPISCRHKIQHYQRIEFDYMELEEWT